ncbi:MAG: flagellar basal body L-ring protein FlgH [Planctomycetota bacterium]
MNGKLAIAAITLTTCTTGWAFAQSASLLGRPATPPTVQGPLPPAPTVTQVSLIRVPEPTPFRLHDLVQIDVDEQVRNTNNARVNRQKNTQYQISFNDLVVLLSGLRLRADQAIQQNPPTVDIQGINTVRNNAQFQRNERIRYKIQAQVEEIKPNGNLVLEAHGTVAVNNEVNSFRFSGIVNPADIDPITRTISSSRVASKRVELFQVGPTRDGYKRGWMVRVIDMFGAF